MCVKTTSKRKETIKSQAYGTGLTPALESKEHRRSRLTWATKSKSKTQVKKKKNKTKQTASYNPRNASIKVPFPHTGELYLRGRQIKSKNFIQNGNRNGSRHKNGGGEVKGMEEGDGMGTGIRV